MSLEISKETINVDGIPMAKYRCPHCKRIVERDATKRWLKSYCEKSGKYVRLQRVGDREEDGV